MATTNIGNIKHYVSNMESELVTQIAKKLKNNLP